MVYFISDGEKIKIGYSNTLKQRIKNLQTANGNKLKLLYIIEDVEPSFEKHVHEICQKFRLEGEWFKPECIEHLFKTPWFVENMITFNKLKQD